jgi:hypothetical protein
MDTVEFYLYSSMSSFDVSLYQYTTDDKFLNGVFVTCDNFCIGDNDTGNKFLASIKNDNNFSMVQYTIEEVSIL